MHKTLLLLLIIIISSNQILWAQNQIKGTVSSGDSLKGFKGVTINVKGSDITTTTGDDGQYTITAPLNATKLIFSAAGSKTLEVFIAGKTTINVQLANDVVLLETTVVTALGIKGERDKLTSSISTVRG